MKKRLKRRFVPLETRLVFSIFAYSIIIFLLNSHSLCILFLTVVHLKHDFDDDGGNDIDFECTTAGSSTTPEVGATAGSSTTPEVGATAEATTTRASISKCQCCICQTFRASLRASAASAKPPAKKTAAGLVVASKAAATRVVGAARAVSPVPATSKGTVCIMFTGFNPTRDHMEVSIELLMFWFHNPISLLHSATSPSILHYEIDD